MEGIGYRFLFRIVSVAVVAAALTLFSLPPVHAMGDVGVVVEKVDEGGQADRCVYCGRSLRAGPVHKDAEVVVANQVKNALTRKGIGFVSGGGRVPTIGVFIYRFEERQGGNFAVERPARVALHMHLMDKQTVVRTFVFDETQESLSQNVLGVGKFLRRGGKWVTAEALSEEGVEAGLTHLLQGLE